MYGLAILVVADLLAVHPRPAELVRLLVDDALEARVGGEVPGGGQPRTTRADDRHPPNSSHSEQVKALTRPDQTERCDFFASLFSQADLANPHGIGGNKRARNQAGLSRLASPTAFFRLYMLFMELLVFLHSSVLLSFNSLR